MAAGRWVHRVPALCPGLVQKMGAYEAAVRELTPGTRQLTWSRAARSSMFHDTEARLASQSLRPRDLALLLLASGDLRPRKRARDPQADVLGLELKRAILQRVAALDPEPADLDAVLVRIVEETSTPTGPARAVARVV